MASPTSILPDVNMGPAILASTLSVVAVALVTVLLRLYVRIGMTGNIGLDDYMIMIAMLLSITGECIIIPEVSNGAGRHIQYLNGAQITNGLMLNYITQPIFLCAITFVKMSVGFFLLRIASTKFWRGLISGIMVFMAIYTVACLFTVIFQCNNPKALWDVTVKTKCLSVPVLKGLGYLNAALNILTDFVFATVIPIPMLWGIQMNNRTKSSVVCILGLGVFASAAALVKLSYLPSYGKTGDWLWDSRNLTIWTVVECSVGIIAADLPALKPLFRSVLRLTSYGTGSQSHPPGSRYYGANSHVRSVNKYDTLGSKQSHHATFDAIPLQPGVKKDTKIITKVTAPSATTAGSDEVTSDAISEDSILALEGPRLGITKTTVTQVSFNKKNEMEPERQVEYKV